MDRKCNTPSCGFFYSWKVTPVSSTRHPSCGSPNSFYIIFSFEYCEVRWRGVALTTNWLGLRIGCSERCVTKCFSFFYSVHVQKLPLWRNCAVGGSRILCFGYWLGHKLNLNGYKLNRNITVQKQQHYWNWATYLCRVIHFNRQN